MKNLKSGFTLIEMLVVIAIIGILTGIIMTNISPTRAKARDGKRISDIGQIQLALEQYFDRCNAYPSTLDSTTAGDCKASPSANIFLSNFISTIPKAPNDPTETYGYFPIGTTDYVLHAALEEESAVVKDGIASVNPGAGFTCSTDLAQKQYCVGPR